MKNFFLWWLMFLLFILATEATLYHFGILKISSWEDPLFYSVLKIIGIVVLAPIAEELFFRGLILFKLRQWKVNKHLGVILQAVFFVVLHAFAYENTLLENIGIAQIFIDAIIYAYAMYKTRSIYTPIALHATGNLIAVLEQFIF